MKGVFQFGFVLLSLSVVLTGCGDSGSGVDTARVSGKVTVAGQSTANIIVSFVPEGGGRPASGTTDASGNYTLATYTSGDGAVPGKHKVVFSFAQDPPPSDQPDAALPPAPFNAKYLNGDTSGFVEEVKAGEANVFDFDLEK
jgi:hypothetical protein